MTSGRTYTVKKTQCYVATSFIEPTYMKKIMLLIAATFVFSAAMAQHLEYKWHGIYGAIDYSYMKEVSNINPSFNGFTGVFGFQFRKESGVGIGVSYMADPMGSYSHLPIFLELRSHYLRSRFTPFTSVMLGYAIPLGTTGLPTLEGETLKITEGGVHLGLRAGARFAITRTFGFNFFVGYRMSFMNEVEHSFEGLRAELRPAQLHIVEFGAGLNF